jgi:protease IV
LFLYPFRWLWWLVSSIRRSIGKPPPYVVFILEDSLPALPDPPRPFWQRPLTGRARLSIRELGERFEAIGKDGRIKGVVLHLRPVEMSMASLQDLREIVHKLRVSGKRVVAWATNYTTGTYYLACACDEILLMPSGAVQPLGFETTGAFLADGLARVGLSADFIQVSPYKSAADPLTKSRMTPEYREQLTWLLESHHSDLVAAISEGRKLDEPAARELIDCAPYGDDTALSQHVVDGVVTEEELPARLGGEVGSWEATERKLRRAAPKLRLGKYVALIRIEGTIIDGRSGRVPVRPPVNVPLLGEDRAGDLTVVQLARQVASDRRAAAVVLYVNSRGGSSTASEAMRHALVAIAARKPLVVVMGSVAGSGGYDVAAPASWIVARSGTLTGSIGVLGGKIVAGPLFDLISVNRETVALGKHVTMNTDERPYTDEERELVSREIDRIYRGFLDVVAASRKMPREALEPIAQGKVWTGRQALERKLVDEIGGLDAGLKKARVLASLPSSAPMREVRGPRRYVPPLAATASPTAWLGYMLEGLTMLNRAPALA